ncbi:MAG TPA: fibronectin type III domain-containing protein [Gemmatimonadales bacterium]|nr:fibronectin type III domain-containing protein [Gemmatimonadales bacterium]
MACTDRSVTSLSSASSVSHLSGAVTPSSPGQVLNLSVAGVTQTSVSLTFTEVDDGTGQPAQYDVRYAPPPSLSNYGWGGAPSVTSGTCTTPVAGTTIGAVHSCTITGLAAGKAYEFQLVPFRGTYSTSSTSLVFGSLSNVASATTAASATTVAGPPGQVQNLAVASVTSTSVTLAFTEVTDGTGQPAQYDVRYAPAPTLSNYGWGLASTVTSGTCTTPVAGTTIGAARSCTITGLGAGKAYQFQLVAFRGTYSASSTSLVFGSLSNVASATTAAGPPGTVQNLAVASVTSTSVTLAFTEVTNGTGQPAQYDVRYALAPALSNYGWGQASSVTSGTCATPVAGTTIGAVRSCTITGLAAGKAYQFQLVAFRGTYSTSSTSLVFGSLSNVASATTPAGTVVPVAAVTVSPATASLSNGQTVQLTATPKDASGTPLSGRVVTWAMSNAAVATVSGSGLVTGGGAGTATITATSEGQSGASAVTVTVVPVASVAVSPATASLSNGQTVQLTATPKDASGTPLSGRVVTWATSNAAVATVSGSGLVTGVVPGTATITATSEGQSGASAITVTVVTGGVVFQSDWPVVGTTAAAVSDGGKWASYWEFNNGTTVQLLSVVPGGPGGRNALQVIQRGSTYAAAVQQDNILPPSTDFYVRYYMRNDDTSPAGDHLVVAGIYSYQNLIYMRKYSGATGWQFVIGVYGCTYTYPVGYWGPSAPLSHGAWYRFEYFVHYVDATHVQIHPRVYDVNGTQILGDADFQQSDYGTAVWNGSNTWTLASYYAAGYNLCVTPSALTSFSVGNNGQQGALDTGLPWFYAGVEIRTDHWAGP